MNAQNIDKQGKRVARLVARAWLGIWYPVPVPVPGKDCNPTHCMGESSRVDMKEFCSPIYGQNEDTGASRSLIFLTRGQVLSVHAGTFLYVAFMEVIPRELADPSHRSAKLCMLMLGFAAMSLLAIWA